MKDKIKGLITGLIIGMTIVSTGVLATTGAIQKELWYNNIKITLDNKEVKPTDANGNYVEPFIIDGTTYLPVRAVSNALGLNVDWDENTNTVKLSTKTSQSATNTQQNVGKVIYNENGIKVTYLGYELGKSSTYYLDLKLLVENNSSQEVTLYSDDGKTSINGFMANGLMVSEVYPGKKLNGRFYFSQRELEENNISSIDSLEIGFYYEFNDKYVYAGPFTVVGSNNTSTVSNKTEINNNNYDIQVSKNGFEEAKKYLKQYGYKHSKSSSDITYEYDKNVSGGTVTVMYKEKTDTILMRYEPDYVYGYDIANVIIEFADGSNTVDVSMFIAPDDVIKTYSPEKTVNKSDISRNYSIRFNDNSIPQSIQQSVDEFATQGIQLLLSSANDILSKGNITVKDLGFTNY